MGQAFGSAPFLCPVQNAPCLHTIFISVPCNGSFRGKHRVVQGQTSGRSGANIGSFGGKHRGFSGKTLCQHGTNSTLSLLQDARLSAIRRASYINKTCVLHQQDVRLTLTRRASCKQIVTANNVKRHGILGKTPWRLSEKYA